MGDLIRLGLKVPSSVQTRQDELSGWLTPTQLGIASGQPIGPYRQPAVIAACTARLNSVLAVSAPDQIRQWVPWLSAKLVSRGEAALVVRVMGGEAFLFPADVVNIRGRLDSLTYSLQIPGPDRILTFDNMPQEAVAHLVLHPCPVRPWRGRPWAEVAGPEGVALAQLLARFREETLGPTGRVLARVAGSGGGSIDWYEQTTRKLSQMRGGMAMLGDNLQAPQSGPPALLRVGTDIPSSVLTAYEKLSASVAQSMGFPPQLVGIAATGATARRDMLATWVRAVVAGWVSSWVLELGRVLEEDISWDLTKALQTDNLPGRLRGAATLRAAGWSQEDSERLAGLS